MTISFQRIQTHPIMLENAISVDFCSCMYAENSKKFKKISVIFELCVKFDRKYDFERRKYVAYRLRIVSPFDWKWENWTCFYQSLVFFPNNFFLFFFSFQKLIFEDGGEIFSLWKSPPVDIYIKIYLWNITNSEAFLSGKEKMQLEEVGPYVYRWIIN